MCCVQGEVSSTSYSTCTAKPTHPSHQIVLTLLLQAAGDLGGLHSGDADTDAARLAVHQPVRARLRPNNHALHFYRSGSGSALELSAGAHVPQNDPAAPVHRIRGNGVCVRRARN
eukprot:77462-Prorocentrum_minimum.AAC.1